MATDMMAHQDGEQGDLFRGGGFPIEVAGVTKRYGERAVVVDLSFVARPGRVTGFLGPNGSGKSTTMKVMLDLASADGGGVTTARRAGVMLRRDAFVFSHEPDGHQPWRPDSTSRAFRVLRHELGLDHVRLHDLRHFVATRLLASGVDVRTVSGRLGHSLTSTTLNVYGAFVPAADRCAADVMGRLVAGGTEVA
jgi:energy-coupling factor transporter ATP-binding protein EcfA2